MKSVAQRTLASVVAMLAVSIVTRAAAQTPAPGWKVIVRIVPNPLPLGRCAAIRVEVQDDEGFQTVRLANGSAVDSRTFKLESSNASSFRWQNGNPTEGYLCTNANAAPGRTMVTVTMPNGLVGNVELTSIAAGQRAAPVTYPPQGPLRIAGRERTTVAVTPPVVTTPAVVTTPSTDAPSSFRPSSVRVTTVPLAFSGTNFVAGTVRIIAPTLAFGGSWFVLSTVRITTEPLVLTFKYNTPPQSTTKP
ncbi:MAG: hypothetical protein ABJD07_09850 [Gemmatimonadaceae bacterium]